MSIIGSVMDKVMRRGLYKAYVGDKMITMCQDCKNNVTDTGGFKSAPAHRCSVEWTLDGKNKLIIDPYNVPAWCPHRMVDVTDIAVTQ